MAAAACGSHSCQHRALEHALNCVASLAACKAVTPVLFMHHQAFDETPLRMKVPFSGVSTLQVAKILALQCRWGMVLQLHNHDPEKPEDAEHEYLWLQGELSPCLRAVEKATGKNMAIPVQETLLPPKRIEGMFEMCLRVGESDSAGANGVAQLLLRDEWPHTLFLPVPCLCHQTHTVCKKTFDLMPASLQGLARSSLVMHQAGVYAGMKDAALERLSRTFRRVALPDGDVPPLSRAATTFREHVLQLFTPTTSARAKATVTAAAELFFNGDWRDGAHILHRCARGCFADHESSLFRAQTLLASIFLRVKPRVLCRGNWLHWHHCVASIGFLLAFHKMLLPVFKQSVSKFEDFENDADVGGDDLEADKIRALRLEAAQHRRQALQWLESPRPLEEVMLLRASLLGEVHLMQELVRMTSREWEVAMLSSQCRTGRRDFRVVELAKTRPSSTTLTSTAALLRDDSLCQFLSRTHAHLSEVWCAMVRAGACVFQLVHAPLKVYPTRLFLLVDGAADTAQAFLDTPECCLDEVSLKFRALHPTVPDLLGSRAQEKLKMLSHHIVANTFKTETFHSKNARRVQTRYNTRAIDLPFLATSHYDTARAEWTTELDTQEQDEANPWVVMFQFRLRMPIQKLEHLEFLRLPSLVTACSFKCLTLVLMKHICVTAVSQFKSTQLSCLRKSLVLLSLFELELLEQDCHQPSSSGRAFPWSGL